MVRTGPIQKVSKNNFSIAKNIKTLYDIYQLKS